MEFSLTDALYEINWFWYIIAVIVAFPTGAIWYAAIWVKPWMRIFHSVMPTQLRWLPWIRSFLIQLVTSAMLCLLMFLLVGLSIHLAAYALLTIAAWQVCEMTFKVSSFRDLVIGTLIEPGYTLVAGGIFILFGTIA